MFKRGNIVSLSLVNFQTFKSQSFNFGPNLNLIVAPNGTGKSSIANALAFVFNGGVKTIGKTKDIKDYIRFGERQAIIECSVYFNSIYSSEVKRVKHSENLVVLKRVIDVEGGSRFYIDDKMCGKMEYLNFVKSSLCIDCKNLTNFLPQEKVAEFVQMKPVQLFEESYRSLLYNNVLLEEVENLYSVQKEMEIMEQNILWEKKSVERINDNLNVMETDINKFIKYENNEREIRLLKFKNLFVSHNKKSALFMQLKEEHRVSEESKILLENEIVELEGTIKEYETNTALLEYQNMVTSYLDKNKIISESCGKVKEIVNKIILEEHKKVKIVEDNKKIREENEAKKKQMGENEEKIKKFAEKIRNKAKVHLNNLERVENEFNLISIPQNYLSPGKLEEFTQKINGGELLKGEDFESVVPSKISQLIDAEYERVRGEMDILTGKTGRIQVEINELQKEKNSYLEGKSRREDLLKRYHRDTFYAVQFLRENNIGVEFLEPAFLHIEIDNGFGSFWLVLSNVKK